MEGIKQGGGGGTMVLTQPPNDNPITVFQTKYKELEIGIHGWLTTHKSSLPLAVIKSSVNGAAIGYIGGAIMGIVLPDAIFPPFFLQGSQQDLCRLSCGPLIQARNHAVMNAVYGGICCVMDRIRGKQDDVQTVMFAAFGGGAMLSLVINAGNGMGGTNMATEAVRSGIGFALWYGGGHHLFGKTLLSPPPPVEEKEKLYTRTRCVLSNAGLGLQNYEKNFTKGLCTNSGMPLLLTDGDLRDLKIPLDERLLILESIRSDPELPKKR